MAVGLAVESEGAVGRDNGKITSFAILSCMMAAMGGGGGFIFGYDVGISGNFVVCVFCSCSNYTRIEIFSLCIVLKRLSF